MQMQTASAPKKQCPEAVNATTSIAMSDIGANKSDTCAVASCTRN